LKYEPQKSYELSLPLIVAKYFFDNSMHIGQFIVKFIDVVCCKFKHALNLSTQIIA